jgi:hypothetical protein
MNGKIRVTVIATGFNEQSMGKKRDERAMMLNVPGVKNETEKSAEQISMPLQFPLRHERAEEFGPVSRERGGAAEVETARTTADSAAPATTQTLPEHTLPFVPPFLLPEGKRRGEQRAHSDRSTVLTQYENDTDIPTFLRKQMQ